MNNGYTLDYLVSGVDKPRGYLFRWLDGFKNDPASAG